MADRVVEVRDGGARSWIGGYSDWQARRAPPAETSRSLSLAGGGSIGA
jgi:hypothetical protein